MNRLVVLVAVAVLGLVGIGVLLVQEAPLDQSVILNPIGTHSAAQTVPPVPAIVDNSWTVLLTGDIIPARVTNQRMVEKQDFHWPIVAIREVLKNVDLTLANLEAPLLSSCPILTTGFKFCGDARFAGAMADAGIDVVNLANNHTTNFGWEGIKETELHMAENGILSTGFTMDDADPCKGITSCSKPTIQVVNGIRVGFLGYNGVGQRFQEHIIRSQIEDLKRRVEYVIISVHWGKEYEREPVPDTSLAPDDPTVWGRKFIDWGADLVAGNHPHWYQGIEWYSSAGGVPKPIVYAQGNTIFDQEWSVDTKRGYLVKFTVNGTVTQRNTVEYFPIGIRDWGQAYLLEGKEQEEVLKFLHNSQL